MANTDLDEVASAVQEFWSPLFQERLSQTNLLVNLCNRAYEGDMRDQGNTVHVNMINKPAGQTLTIDGSGGGRSFTPDAMGLQTVAIVADTRIVASYDIHDIVQLQSLIDPFSQTSQDAREAMVESINDRLNTWLYAKITASQTIASVTTMTAQTVADAREIAATQKWGHAKPWYGLLAPGYYSDLLVDTTFTSKDFVGEDIPVVNGQMALPRYGFNIFEDNSQAVSATGGGIFFHPDFLYLVMQQQPRFKISDKHAQHEFAFVFSIDMVVGAVLGIQGNLRNIKVQSGP